MAIDLKRIPRGPYCHGKDSYGNVGVCPYWSAIEGQHHQENGHCSFLGKGDKETGGLLWDQVKECEIHNFINGDDE